MVLNTYAAYSLNQSERLDSSSGGLFSLIAKSVLANRGIVYGVAMTENCRRAEFIRVTEESDLYRLRGSKYLQAHVGQTYKEIKLDLDNGKSVLFSGTGCQVNGLKGFLGDGKYDRESFEQKYPNLYCVDVICHGVPSPKLWERYVSLIEETYNSKLVEVNFRCKEDSWKDFGMKQISSDKKQVYISKDKDPYMLMFLRDYCLRPSCYECRAKSIKMSDITLADFWGIDAVAPELNDGNGSSLVLIRSPKGKKILNTVINGIIFKEVSYEEGVSHNPAEFRSATRPSERDYFFKDMEELTFEELKSKYGTPKLISVSKKIKSMMKKILVRSGIYGG